MPLSRPFFSFLNVIFYFLRKIEGERETERERESKKGRGRDRGRERIQSRFRVASTEPDVGLEPTSRETMT